MANVQVIDIPLTKEHADTILLALQFYYDHASHLTDWQYPGDTKVMEEIEYIRAIVNFYEAAEVLNGKKD